MKEQHINLIVKYLSKETSEQENKLFLAQNKKNSEFNDTYKDILEIWNISKTEEFQFDKKRILKLIQEKTSIRKEKAIKFPVYSILKYAAIFLTLIVLSIFIVNDLKNIKTIVNNTNQIQKIELPDNSIITLNTNAEIKYNNSLLKSFSREISLEGEAFFEITKAENKKFIVRTTDFDITVYGTNFNVMSKQKNSSVVLTKGKILVNNFKNQDSKYILKPGDIVKYNSKEKIFEHKNVNTKIYTSWLDDKLLFDNFSLKELSELLKIRYGKELVFINKQIANKKISGSAPSDDINLIIKALETILKTNITQKNNQLIIN